MLTAGQAATGAYMTGGGVVCVECGEKRMAEMLKEQGTSREEMIGQRHIDYTNKHGHAPDNWQAQRLEEDVDRKIEEMADDEGISPICQYTLDSEFYGDGCSCDDCGEVLVESEPEEGEYDEAMDDDIDDDMDDETGEAQ